MLPILPDFRIPSLANSIVRAKIKFVLCYICLLILYAGVFIDVTSFSKNYFLAFAKSVFHKFYSHRPILIEVKA